MLLLRVILGGLGGFWGNLGYFEVVGGGFSWGGLGGL